MWNLSDPKEMLFSFIPLLRIIKFFCVCICMNVAIKSSCHFLDFRALYKIENSAVQKKLKKIRPDRTERKKTNTYCEINRTERDTRRGLNPSTAPACQISGLKGAHNTRLQTVYLIIIIVIIIMEICKAPTLRLKALNKA